MEVPLSTREKKQCFHRLASRLQKEGYRVLLYGDPSAFLLQVTHKQCGRMFRLPMDHFLNGYRCHCEGSSGERRIAAHLDSRGVSYEREVCLEGCRHRGPLPFDIALYAKGRLLAVIEYDGKHHSSPMKGEPAGKGQDRREKDRIKDGYCMEREIPLLRIPYTHFEKIETIVDAFLKRLR